MKSKTSALSVIGSTATDNAPPIKLGTAGRALWTSIMTEYNIVDAGGVSILTQICTAEDRASALSAQIAIDGVTIQTKAGLREHPALKHELACRAFITRNLVRLGINVAAIKPVGRPGAF